MKFLSFIVSIYMMIIFVRIILTWFSWERNSGFMGFLSGITDPYLDWFRRFPFLRTGFIDFSPIAALGVLSLVNRIFAMLASQGTIRLGIVLALVLQLAWSVVSFLIGFSIIVLILRLISLFVARGSTGTFWRIIDSLSQPILQKVGRIFFKNRIVNYRTGLLVSIACFAAIYFVLRFLAFFVSAMLVNLPV